MSSLSYSIIDASLANCHIDPNNVAGGYKATLNNPNTSEEAKERAHKKLEAMDNADSPGMFLSALLSRC